MIYPPPSNIDNIDEKIVMNSGDTIPLNEHIENIESIYKKQNFIVSHKLAEKAGFGKNMLDKENNPTHLLGNSGVGGGGDCTQ
jgi:putative ribosome biogenesis GTPase RsgA